MPKIEVDREALEEMLARFKADAFRSNCRYDPDLRQHVCTDEMWERGDPEGFKTFNTLMAPLLAADDVKPA